MKWRLPWPIFCGLVILPSIEFSWSCEFALDLEYFMYKPRTFWLSQYDLVLPQNKCRSQWSIFQGPVILLFILTRIWCINVIFLDYESVWPKDWPQNKWSQWHTSDDPVILPYILKCIWCINHTDILWVSMTQSLTSNVGHCVLHFMVLCDIYV